MIDPATITALQRQIADHERAAAELRKILPAELSSTANGASLEATVLAHLARSNIELLPGDLLLEKDAASLLGLKPKTLRNRRYQLDDDLPHVTYAGRIAYRLADVIAYLERHGE